MNTRLTITGGAELVALYESLPTKVRRGKLITLLAEAGEPMRQRMGELAPRRPPQPDLADHIIMSPAVKIGSLAGGRGRARTDTEAALAIGPAQPFFYGIFLEYGTVHASASPFMRPAFDATVEPVLGRFQDGIWETLATAVAAAPKGPAA